MNELEEQRWRLYFLLSIIAIFMLVVASRLFYIQIIQHDYYSLQARKEHWSKEVVPAKRGAILDSSGRVLAASVDFESLYATTNQITHPEKTAQALAPLIGEPESQILASLAVRKAAPVLVKAYLTADQADAVRKAGIGGVYLQSEFKRVHSEGNLAAQLLGLVGRDDQGLTGIEAAYDAELAGKPGSLLAERDTGGDEIALSVQQYTPPKNGVNVTLTIDRYIQTIAEQELDTAVNQHHAKGGTIVVMDPRTGAILAMANGPSFNYNDPGLFDADKAPLYRNSAIADAWEPGSIFKIVTMSAGLDSGTVTPETSFYNSGAFVYAGGVIRNVITRIGPETMTQVLQRSSNIGASFVSTKLGADEFYKYVDAFGLGRRTGIGLPGESAGIVRTNKASDWYPFDLATNSFGQGISVTAVQMVAAAAAAINGGTLMRPYVVKSVSGGGIHRDYEPAIVRQVISPEISKELVNMLVSVVDVHQGGEVQEAAVPGYLVGGKTGTAQIPTNQGYTSANTIASFVGFGPASDPRFIVLVKIDDPQDTPWGETAAAPVFKIIAQQLFAYMHIPPTDPNQVPGNILASGAGR